MSTFIDHRYLSLEKNTCFLSGETELANRFMDLLAKNFIREKRVNFYADSLGITPRHLSQVVKLVTHKTAGELINEMITKQAKLLLTSHGINVSKVAAALGFSTSSFSGKYLKKTNWSITSALEISPSCRILNYIVYVF